MRLYKVLIPCLIFGSVASLWSAVYEVGPGQALSAIGEVPWESLQPGDTVRIHWREEAYKEKWVIGRQGTEAQEVLQTVELPEFGKP